MLPFFFFPKHMASTGPSSLSLSLSLPMHASLCLHLASSWAVSRVVSVAVCSWAGESARHGQRVGRESSIKAGLQYAAHDLSRWKGMTQQHIHCQIRTSHIHNTSFG